MQKVYIVQVRGWGDDEDAMYNISAFSSRELADAYIAEIRADYEGEQVDADVDVMTVDAQ
jgi:hypothetical protein